MGRDLFQCRQQKRKLDLELDPFLTPRPGDLIQNQLLLRGFQRAVGSSRSAGLDLLFLPSQTSKEALSLFLSLEPFQMLVLDPFISGDPEVSWTVRSGDWDPPGACRSLLRSGHTADRARALKLTIDKIVKRCGAG